VISTRDAGLRRSGAVIFGLPQEPVKPASALLFRVNQTLGYYFIANFASLCPHILIFNGFDIRFAGNNRNVADMTHAVKQIELLFHLSRMHFSNSCMR